ncbi:chromosomal replication initiator protein DnaA [Inhella gelatinilytica]|uniref:Chromosomal replication initiator protein DnaA n=1 Tax=Inhella gelatinilytica TaxID=2795030 RepID=A0A931ISA6_9BURK|nr:chromosomal replication initiator protein DnaA [Inhella gelatinilytica]MBH9551755.1 chromosomal replication initiator protein DnaA [Inhella gelatinilytica]
MSVQESPIPLGSAAASLPPRSAGESGASSTLWPQVCERLATELPEQQFNTWIRPLTPAVAVREDAGLKLRLAVPNRFKLDWIRAQYAHRIESLAGELAAEPVRLDLHVVLVRDTPITRPPVPGAVGVPVPAAVTVTPTGVKAVPTGTWAGGAATAASNRLNPALTFDTLVPGRANQMARTAALHVAGAPGAMYNPLFIYGGVGLGKTHLMNAVGNQLLQDKPDARVLYLHAEQFITDVVKNYQRKTFDELKAKYHSLDLLLIDDVQFFAGKERTQEEFFNAFEALLAKKAHIIMTSDTYPKGLVDIDERLTSRFDSGLTVAIEPPELEMRVAILMRKAEQEGTPMPEDVAFFVAKNVRANVRELEGALRKVLAYSRFSGKDINIQLAREALKDLLSIQNRQIGVENIQKTVADFYKIKVADMYSKKRPASIARPRQIAMYLAKELTQKSLPEIGDLFGGRDHTTVLHAVRKIGGERQKDTELNQQLHVLEQTLKG